MEGESETKWWRENLPEGWWFKRAIRVAWPGGEAIRVGVVEDRGGNEFRVPRDLAEALLRAARAGLSEALHGERGKAVERAADAAFADPGGDAPDGEWWAGAAPAGWEVAAFGGREWAECRDPSEDWWRLRVREGGEVAIRRLRPGERAWAEARRREDEGWWRDRVPVRFELREFHGRVRAAWGLGGEGPPSPPDGSPGSWWAARAPSDWRLEGSKGRESASLVDPSGLGWELLWDGGAERGVARCVATARERRWAGMLPAGLAVVSLAPGAVRVRDAQGAVWAAEEGPGGSVLLTACRVAGAGEAGGDD